MLRALVVAVGVLAAVAWAHAAEWVTIRPGESTQAAVRARFGEPTKVSSQKVEGYDTAQWLYEGAQAPPGALRVTIDFGLLAAGAYRADVVRTIRLEPRPGIFNRTIVLNGWGAPERVGKEKEADIFYYESGLLVFFEKDGWLAHTLIFTPPQRPAQGGAPRPR
jgi:hypothetical protein